MTFVEASCRHALTTIGGSGTFVGATKEQTLVGVKDRMDLVGATKGQALLGTRCRGQCDTREGHMDLRFGQNQRLP